MDLNLFGLIPNAEPEEISYLETIVKDLSEEQLKNFALMYSSKRKDPQTILITTLLGFISLTAVSAKPLRDLGIAGAIGSLVAIVVAYSVFPAFLRMANKSHAKKRGKIEEVQLTTYKFIDLEKQFLMLIIFVTCLLTLFQEKIDSCGLSIAFFKHVLH